MNHELLDHLDSLPPIQVKSKTIQYRIALILVTLMMVLLPLVYLSLIGLGIFALYYHIMHNWVVFQNSASTNGAIFVYIAPIVIGVILLFFMIKPFFAPKTKDMSPKILSPEDEPLLFAFVEKICDLVGAVKPSEIHIDNQVNASASFRHGMWSFLSNELVLTIGMPLVRGMKLQSFAGILAHEFGHFSQSGGMRLSYIIRTINYWFLRVVYQRDQWDEDLIKWSQGSDFRVMIILWITRFFVWITRNILWVLMKIGDLTCCFLLRQMEYDADQFETHIAGSKMFGHTSKRLMTLSLASEGAYQDLRQTWNDEGRLPDDLSELIFSNINQIPNDYLKLNHQHMMNTKTAWLATHPSDRDRIAASTRENQIGIFHSSEDADILFQSFTDLSKDVTEQYYRENYGIIVNESMLRSVADVNSQQEEEQKYYETCNRYFLGLLTVLRPLILPDELQDITKNEGQYIPHLHSIRDALTKEQKNYLHLLQLNGKIINRITNILRALSLLNAGVRIKASDFGVSKSDKDLINQELAAVLQEKQKLSEEMKPFEELMIERLKCCYLLLLQPTIQEKIENSSEKLMEFKRLIPSANMSNHILNDLIDLQNQFNETVILANYYEKYQNNESFVKSTVSSLKLLHNKMEDTLHSMAHIYYPFNHVEGEISLRVYACKVLPPKNDFAILDSCEQLLDRLYNLHYRIYGRIAMVAEEVEKKIGLKPIPSKNSDSAHDVN